LKGVALRSRFQSGLKTTCTTSRLSAQRAAMRAAMRSAPRGLPPCSKVPLAAQLIFRLRGGEFVGRNRDPPVLDERRREAFFASLYDRLLLSQG